MLLIYTNHSKTFDENTHKMSRLQLVNELHKTARRNYPRRRVIMRGINDLLQADLVEMIPYSTTNKNFKYLLTIIDTFSKFAWAIPIKNKTANATSSAMESVLKTLKHSPKNLQTDDGTEFFNSIFKKLTSKYGINHYSTYSGLKASIVERFNRTLKSKMWKQFSMQGTYKWIDIISGLVQDYNNTKHRTIKMRPNQVSEKNAKTLLNTVYSHIKKFRRGKFRVGTYVRISKNRHIFDKGYTPNWTTEIFSIAKVQKTNPVTYLLNDYQNNPIKGGFYDAELQKVKYPDTYLVEKIIRKKDGQLYVKWLGMDTTHNSWITEKDML